MTGAALLALSLGAVLVPIRWTGSEWDVQRDVLRTVEARSSEQVRRVLCDAETSAWSFCSPPFFRTPVQPNLGPDTTVTVGRWRGAPLKLRVRIDGSGENAVTVMAITQGRVVAWHPAYGSPLLGPLWDVCKPHPDLDGDGLREIGVPAGNGGGPYSVNVTVAFVRFDPDSATLAEWGSPLFTPRVSRDGHLVERYRGSGFGRAWTRTRYALPADSLRLVESVYYDWVEEDGTLGTDRMRWTRTHARPGRPDDVRVVGMSDLPADEEERFDCS